MSQRRRTPPAVACGAVGALLLVTLGACDKPGTSETTLSGHWIAGAPLVAEAGGMIAPLGHIEKVNHLLRWGSDWVMTGYLGPPPNPRLALWTSADGMVWHNREVPADVLCDGRDAVGIRGPHLLFACSKYNAGADQYDVVVATTADLENWQFHQVGGPGNFLSGIGQVAVFGELVVAIAHDVGFPASLAADRLRMWASSDLVDWVELHPAEGIFNGAVVESFAATADGLLMGGRVNGGPSGRPKPSAAVWASADARHWTRTLLTSGGGSTVVDVAAGGAGLVAVGTVGDDAAAWRSSDGKRWQRASGDGAALGGAGSQVMSNVLATSTGSFLSVGHDDRTGGRQAAAWASADGRVWSRITGAPEVVATGDRGPIGISGGSEPRVWSWGS